MVGVLKPLQRNIAALGCFGLIVGDGPDHLGGKAVAASNLTGDLRLVHCLRRVEAAKQGEEVAQREDDQDDEEKAVADECAGSEISEFGRHGLLAVKGNLEAEFPEFPLERPAAETEKFRGVGAVAGGYG